MVMTLYVKMINKEKVTHDDENCHNGDTPAPSAIYNKILSLTETYVVIRLKQHFISYILPVVINSP